MKEEPAILERPNPSLVRGEILLHLSNVSWASRSKQLESFPMLSYDD